MKFSSLLMKFVYLLLGAYFSITALIEIYIIITAHGVLKPTDTPLFKALLHLGLGAFLLITWFSKQGGEKVKS